MKKLTCSILLLFLFNVQIFAAVWHVSATGDDSNDGKTVATAFRTLQKAADIVKPGDIVLVGNGIYSNNDKSDGGAVLSIKTSGTPDAWITWKAEPGEQPEVKPTGWTGIQITCSYQIIDGFSVMGYNDAIVLADAQADAKKPKPDPYFNTNGIFVNGRTSTPDKKPHHVIIRNCTVGKCPGGGLVAIQTDYITIEDCKVFENAWYMRYGGSGISTLDNWAFDDAPGYHIVIQRNFVWDNKTMVPWEKIGKLSDGNGIILDVTDQDNHGATNPNADAMVNPEGNKPVVTASPNPAQRPEWKGRSLVANNLSAFNGGSGIHTFRTKHVDIINNTTYHNGGIVGYPELFANASEDIVFLNNIMVPRPAGKVTANNKNTNITWDYNLYPVEQIFFKGAHDVVADPQFINIAPDPTKGDYKLKMGSSGLNSGTNDVAQKTDILGNTRPKGAGRDRGAFEQ